MRKLISITITALFLTGCEKSASEKLEGFWIFDEEATKQALAGSSHLKSVIIDGKRGSKIFATETHRKILLRNGGEVLSAVFMTETDRGYLFKCSLEKKTYYSIDKVSGDTWRSESYSSKKLKNPTSITCWRRVDKF